MESLSLLLLDRRHCPPVHLLAQPRCHMCLLHHIRKVSRRNTCFSLAETASKLVHWLVIGQQFYCHITTYFAANKVSYFYKLCVSRSRSRSRSRSNCWDKVKVKFDPWYYHILILGYPRPVRGDLAAGGRSRSRSRSSLASETRSRSSLALESRSRSRLNTRTAGEGQNGGNFWAVFIWIEIWFELFVRILILKNTI